MLRINWLVIDDLLKMFLSKTWSGEEGGSNVVTKVARNPNAMTGKILGIREKKIGQ